jgi:hypothetical protein
MRPDGSALPEHSSRLSWFSRQQNRLSKFFFYGMPKDMRLHEKIGLVKEKSLTGAVWDLFQVYLITYDIRIGTLDVQS